MPSGNVKRHEARCPGRYVVYHSSFGEAIFDTLKEAREFVRDIERRAPYCPSIYDNKAKRKIL